MSETREVWLLNAVERLRPFFPTTQAPPAFIRVACGWPKGSKLLGECWHASAARDGVRQIYISPKIEKSVEVLDTLLHELVHASLPDGVGHKGKFVTLCKKVGLTMGPAKSQSAGPELITKLELLSEDLGLYPHCKLVPIVHEKKQMTRMLKAVCVANGDHGEDYIVRLSRKTIEIGLPMCPCGKEMVIEEKPDES